MKKPRGRLSKRDQILALNAAQRHVAWLGGKEPDQAFQQAVPKERAARKPSGKPLERDILRNIVRVLRRHPKVATVERRQSAVFMEGGRHIRVGRRGDPDIGGILQGGRAYAIEVKRPGEQPSEIQAARLQEIAAAGGVAGCAHSVGEALSIIEAA